MRLCSWQARPYPELFSKSGQSGDTCTPSAGAAIFASQPATLKSRLRGAVSAQPGLW